MDPQQPSVVTVRGLIEPADLGVMLSHDHLIVDGWAMFRAYATVLDDEATVTDEMRRYRAAGGRALADPTNIGIGRDPRALRRISEATDVHIVMGAGWYREAVYPHDLDSRSSDDLADQLVRELTQGVGDTGVRAGFIGVHPP